MIKLRAKFLGFALGAWFVASSAWAQSAVQTYPSPVTTRGGAATNTISGSAFVQLWPAAPASPQGGPSRKGCTIVNYSTSHTLSVSEGASVAEVTATIGLAVVLQPGDKYYCGIVGGVALQGQINVAGTNGETYFAAQY